VANLTCPEYADDDAGGVIYCQVRVNKTGKAIVSESGCFYPEQLPRSRFGYQRATRDTLQKATFVPAMVDGKNVDVLFEFRVLFNWDSDACHVAAIPNWGQEDTEMGINYFAPQLILDHKSSWWARDLSGYFSMWNGSPVAVSVLVSEEGIPSDARWESIRTSGIALETSEIAIVQSRNRSVLGSLAKSRFIPGIFKGDPVAMRFHGVVVKFKN
jgi:hypothetical protein